MKKALSVMLSFLLVLGLTACDSTTVQQEVQKGVESVIIEDALLFNDITSINEEEEKAPSKYLEKIQVYFIDVGQADSALIVTPNKDAILIDAGEKEDVDEIIELLKETGVKDLDLVVATHPHADHIGGMQEVIETYDAQEILMSSHITTTKTFENLLDSIEQQGKGVTQVTTGLNREIDGVKIEVVSSDMLPDDANNSSIVLKVEYGEVSMLFTGDIEDKAEQVILSYGFDIEADILKVAHHGSETSTTDRFLDRVKPKLAVISVGKDNKYNHPSAQTIDKLIQKGVKFYRTDEDGTVMLEIDGVDIITILSNSFLETKPKMAMRSNTNEVMLFSTNEEVAEVMMVAEVFVSKESNKYHFKPGCEGLKGSTETISIDLAREKGLIECEICSK